MLNLSLILIAILVWSFIGIIPASLAGERRKKGKPVYSWVLIMAVATEIVISLSILQLSGKLYIVSFAPLVGTAVGSFIYLKITKKKDLNNVPKL